MRRKKTSKFDIMIVAFSTISPKDILPMARSRGKDEEEVSQMFSEPDQVKGIHILVLIVHPANSAQHFH